MEDNKTDKEKVFSFQDSAHLESFVEIFQSKHFKCYACMGVKSIQDIGRVIEFKDTFGTGIRKYPIYKYAICRTCNHRVDAIAKLDVLEAVFTLMRCESNVLYELFPSDIKRRFSHKGVSIWNEGE